jgi:hypothetical protein
MSGKTALFGLAKNEDQAASIVNLLKGAGFSDNDISVLLPDRSRNRRFAHEEYTRTPEGAAVNSAGFYTSSLVRRQGYE